MKKMIFLFVVFVLLAGCQAAPTSVPCAPTSIPPTNPPAPTPIPADTEILADSISLVIGTWYSQMGNFIDIRGTGSSTDLSFNLYVAAEATTWFNLGSGTMAFDNGKLKWLTVKGDCADAQEATYEIYLVRHEGRVIGMRPKLVGEDACPNRKGTMQNMLLEYVGPLFFIER